MGDTREISVIEVNKNVSATKNLFLLHGYGADAYDLISVGDQIADFNRYNVYTLGAPIALAHGGFSWYDITVGPDGVTRTVGDDYFDAVAQVNEIIADISSPETSVISGFSQGGSIALAASITKPYLFTFGWSTYLPSNFTGQSNQDRNNEYNLVGKRFLMSHGQIDPIVNFHLGEKTAEWLEENGAEVTFIKHDGVHEIDYSTMSTCRKVLVELE